MAQNYHYDCVPTRPSVGIEKAVDAFIEYLIYTADYTAPFDRDLPDADGVVHLATREAIRPEDPVAFFREMGTPPCFTLQDVTASVPRDVSTRPSWHRYFVDMTHLVATRATCDRKHVGAVIVRDKRVVATGYNGSPPGLPHCDDVGHDIVTQADGKENCVRTVHAEMNAILQAAQYGVPLAGTTLYTNTYPCWHCAKAILGARIATVVVDKDYNNDPRVAEALRASGVRLVALAEVEREGP